MCFSYLDTTLNGQNMGCFFVFCMADEEESVCRIENFMSSLCVHCEKWQRWNLPQILLMTVTQHAKLKWGNGLSVQGTCLCMLLFSLQCNYLPPKTLPPKRCTFCSKRKSGGCMVQPLYCTWSAFCNTCFFLVFLLWNVNISRRFWGSRLISLRFLLLLLFCICICIFWSLIYRSSFCLIWKIYGKIPVL